MPCSWRIHQVRSQSTVLVWLLVEPAFHPTYKRLQVRRELVQPGLPSRRALQYLDGLSCIHKSVVNELPALAAVTHHHQRTAIRQVQSGLVVLARADDTVRHLDLPANVEKAVTTCSDAQTLITSSLVIIERKKPQNYVD